MHNHTHWLDKSEYRWSVVGRAKSFQMNKYLGNKKSAICACYAPAQMIKGLIQNDFLTHAARRKATATTFSTMNKIHRFVPFCFQILHFLTLISFTKSVVYCDDTMANSSFSSSFRFIPFRLNIIIIFIHHPINGYAHRAECKCVKYFIEITSSHFLNVLYNHRGGSSGLFMR